MAAVGGSCVAGTTVPPTTRQGLKALAVRTGAAVLTARLLPGVDGAPWWFDGARVGVDPTAPPACGHHWSAAWG